MKRIFFSTLSLALLTVSGYAQAPNTEPIIIQGEFDNNPADCLNDTVRLFIWTGAMPEEIGHTPVKNINGKAAFAFSLASDYEGAYFVGKEPMQTKMFFVNKEKTIRLTGNCKNINQMKVEGSMINAQYDLLMSRLNVINMHYSQIIQQYRQANPAEGVTLNQELQKLDVQKSGIMDSLKRANPILGRVASMNIYLSYQNNAQMGQTEADYFARNFTKHVAPNDTMNWRYPGYHEMFKNYAMNIAQIGLSDSQQRDYIDQQISMIASPSLNHRAALFGIIIGSMNRNESNFIYFGKKYLDIYGGGNIAMANFVRSRIASLGEAFVGNQAPEITEKNPEGKEISLSSFRGKVTLIDFWASWCGPCRKANPHVKSLYEKYHAKGFEILGVSLDRDKERWIQAIQQDGLNWNHVSDLAQWNSKWSKLYGVSAIPHAVLVDKDGKIIGKQLSPEQVEYELKRIYGE